MREVTFLGVTALYFRIDLYALAPTELAIGEVIASRARNSTGYVIRYVFNNSELERIFLISKL